MEDTPSSEKNIRLNRRRFLKLIATSVGAAAVVKGVKMAGMFQMPAMPDAPDILQPTQIAMEQKGINNSFVEQEGFSKEMFESIKQGTLLMTITGKVKETDVEQKTGGATGWLAKADGNTFYIVTAKHCVTIFEGGVSQVSFARTDVDKQFFKPETMLIAAHPTLDLAVLRCSGKFDTNPPFQVLPWVDNFNPAKGDKELTVGHPGPFYREGIGSLKVNTSAEVGTVIENNENGTWITDNIIWDGTSGSPVVRNDNGQAQVVGLVADYWRKDIDIDILRSQNKPVAIVSKLDVLPLIESLQNQ